MNIIEINLEDLKDLELINVTGGGFFKDLGAASHEAWNSALDSVDSFFATHSFQAHSRQAI
mgnify:CR=1 FL=1